MQRFQLIYTVPAFYTVDSPQMDTHRRNKPIVLKDGIKNILKRKRGSIQVASENPSEIQSLMLCFHTYEVNMCVCILATDSLYTFVT